MANGPVLLGDKEQAEQYKQYNKGHVPDLVQPGATAWGTDWIGETKVASPFTATRHAGHGSRAGGGTRGFSPHNARARGAIAAGH